MEVDTFARWKVLEGLTGFDSKMNVSVSMPSQVTMLVNLGHSHKWQRQLRTCCLINGMLVSFICHKVTEQVILPQPIRPAVEYRVS